MTTTRHPPHIVPDVTFQTRVRDESIGGDNPFRWQELTSNDIFANKRVVLFALPGAFTPTCSSTHLPGYEAHYADFQRLGVDQIICLSVNDAFVMYQWGLKLGANHVFMLPDGNGAFTRGMDMMVEKTNLGFGDRSWRYSMLVDNKRVVKMFIEPDLSDNCPTDPFEVSDANTMLEYLRSQAGD